MSSDDIAIRVQGVSKCYEIYHRPQNRLKQIVLPGLQKVLGQSPKNYYEPFWALKDINFEIKRGESVGIIGQNGSGKSTLLQLITGILRPTTGTVEVNGKVAALIELGSGFNPEFTGRENVYLNASILGLTREETDQKFDQIAAFADIGEHLEMAVKTYSSGMMMRLAFAVQMAVDPDVLIIDEALGVGDAKFQLKCFKKLADLKANGTTILFVSHAVELIRSFCEVGIVLNKGELIYNGNSRAATVIYLSILFPKEHKNELPKAINKDLDTKVIEKYSSSSILRVEPESMDCHTFGLGGARIINFELHDITYPNILTSGQKTKIQCDFTWDLDVINKLILEGYSNNISVGIAFADKQGNYIFGCNGFDAGLEIECINANSCGSAFSFELPFLMEGDYFINISIAFGTLSHHVELKWYDCAIPVKILKSERNVFGLMAIKYQMNITNKTKENISELQSPFIKEL